MSAQRRLRLMRFACIVLAAAAIVYLIVTPTGTYWPLAYLGSWTAFAAGIAGAMTATDQLEKK